MARRIPFEGDDAAYILFLETLVLQLEESLRPSPQQSAPIGTSSTPADYNVASDQHEVIERPRRRTRGVPVARETPSHDSSTQSAPEHPNEPRSIRKDSGSIATFDIIEYNPEVAIDPKKKVKSAPGESKTDVQKTLSRFISFLNGLPKSEIWENWVSALDKTQRRNFLKALLQICGPDASSFASPGTAKESAIMSPKSTDISILSEFANFMVSFGLLNRQLACFLDILFVSLCTVLLDRTEEKDGIYAIMRKVLGSNSSIQLAKFVRGAKWANSLVSLLSKTKWASRSWDILCVAQHPLSFYARFSDCSVNPQEVLAKLELHVDESFILSEPTDSPAPFAIPLIIERVFNHTKSLRNRWNPDCADHEGQEAQCESIRGVNTTTAGSVLPEAQEDDDSELENQSQPPSRSYRCGNTPTTSSPLSSAPVGPVNVSALQKHTASQPFAVVPAPGTKAQLPGTTDAFLMSCPESIADMRNATFLSSKTPDHSLEEPGQERAVFNPLASDALFSLFPNPQLDNSQLNNISGEPGQESAVFNPLASDALFSLFPNPQLDNSQLNNISGEPGQESAVFNPLASNDLFSPFINAGFRSTTTQIGPNSTEVDCATS
ncbi:hypothetical protein N7520_001603 [Penicillium odoratum]|uniref:uncharacterized protein n=1 Tax=Penicillium odoratum TaxID=1167516 RepID=UPI0025486994|nr:uncharacterized protein N7520_001603 [Penicillium odoratum]KAJ5778357.1 hypothetical protein N7520_001603 [Penicillium odoratum]